MLNVSSVRFHDGCLFGLRNRTARVQVAIPAGADRGTLEGFATPGGGDALFPADPLSTYLQGDWLSPCLVGGRGPDLLADLLVGLPTALQILSGWPVGPGQVLAVGGDFVRVALPWHSRALMRPVLAATLRRLNARLAGEDLAESEAEIAELITRYRPGGLTPAGTRLGLSALRRGMPITILNGRVLQIGWGARARQFKSTFSDRSGSIAEQLVRAKAQCNARLARAGLPVPRQAYVATAAEAQSFAARVGWPVVVKPAGLDQGQGIHIGIADDDSLARAFAEVAALDAHGVLVEAFVPGDDHRLLVVDGALIAAARRRPGRIVGDGRSTVAELLAALNADPRRGTGKDSLLMRISPDAELRACLAEQGLEEGDRPAAGREVFLRRIANISTGGTAENVLDRVHPDNRMAAVRAARIAGVDIAGVDFISPDISRSYREVGGVICEINSQPGLRPHWLAEPGEDVTGRILDVRFADRPARIPTAAITGSKGKTTTAMMLHHIWQCAGRTAGVNGTAGTWVGTEQIDTRNLSGVPGAVLLFGDPAVEAAVLEMPRKGLIVYGHACPEYDVAALTNVSQEHIGQDGIETREQMADLKGEILLRARDAVVLNAEDDMSLRAGAEATAPRRILVARDAETPALARHLSGGGDGVFVAPHEGRDWITMARGAARVPVLAVQDIPATVGGRLAVNVMNAMFAAALAEAQNLSGSAIRTGLATFRSSREMNPGRYNFIDGFPFGVIVDYAHTTEGVTQLCDFVRDLPFEGRRHIGIRILGNSGPDKLRQSGPELLATFDRVKVMSDPEMIRKYGHYTGDDAVGDMLRTSREVLSDLGGTETQVSVGADQHAICEGLLREAAPGDLVVLMVDPPLAFDTIDRVRAAAEPR